MSPRGIISICYPVCPRPSPGINRARLHVIVVSNQRGIALGLHTAADVLAIHANLQAALATAGAHIDAFYFCRHDKQQCDCRKPLPGLFHQAVAQFPSITPESSAMIGDSLSDMEFGHRLGMFTVFVDGDPAHQKPGAQSARDLADRRFPNLTEAVEYLLQHLTIHPPSRAIPQIACKVANVSAIPSSSPVIGRSQPSARSPVRSASVKC